MIEGERPVVVDDTSVDLAYFCSRFYVQRKYNLFIKSLFYMHDAWKRIVLS